MKATMTPSATNAGRDGPTIANSTAMIAMLMTMTTISRAIVGAGPSLHQIGEQISFVWLLHDYDPAARRAPKTVQRIMT